MSEWSWAIQAATLATSVIMIMITNARQSARVDEKVRGVEELAKESKAIGLSAHDRIELTNAGLSVYRETIARDMVGKSDMKEVEARIMSAIDRLGERVDRMATRQQHE